MTRLLRRTRPDREAAFDLPALVAGTLGEVAERTARLRNPAALVDEVTGVLREGWRALDRIETVVLARETAALTAHLTSYQQKQHAAQAFRTLHPLPEPPDLRAETVAELLAAGPWDAELLSRSESLAQRAAAVLTGLPPTTATGKTTSRVKVDAALKVFAVAVRDLTARLDRIDRHTANAHNAAAAREDSAEQARMSHARKTLAQYGIEAS
ncbi:hypothetical protein [Nocardia sp. 348MFTsu5.1]|uniref:hypothetical protein n=1 Tax=Nocardia sp. 348MFTsu5.1 TaxID=1172185 RepID=UPI00037E23D2|nr:hypothetical protein [Nocardia sp. 348MFTsu5.1]